jgi:hypothetical protein
VKIHQFTGFRDRNQKEIYEWDIVVWPDDPSLAPRYVLFDQEMGFWRLSGSSYDGFDDLAVGDTTLTSNTGRLSIYLSNGSTISTTVSLTINGNGTSQFFPSANGQYARTIAIADINQDGKNDLIVGNGGATTPGTNQGSIFIFNGCSSNSLCIANGSNASSANFALSGSAVSDFFGYSFSISDINNDGIPDLLTSAKGYNSNRGGLYIFLNKGTGFTTSISNVDRLFTGENVNDNSGASL